MTQEEIKNELFAAASDGCKIKFKELSEQLESSPENVLYINMCGKMLNHNPKMIYDKTNNLQEGDKK